MAKARTYDEKVRDLEKRIKELEVENAELKKQLEKLTPKNVGYKKPKIKERYPTEEAKNMEKKNAIPEVHEDDKGKE